MPLWAAATLAYRTVFSSRADGRRTPSNDELDLVALVLSGYVTIYAGEPRTPLAQEELQHGMFWGGARRFEWSPRGARGSRHRPPLAGLSVRSADFERGLARIRGDLWQET